MRIVAGRWRGRALAVPPGRDVRPTGDRARATLFDVLTHRFHGRDGFSLIGAVVLDAFAGSGALGLEALSRGARAATFFECAAPALAVLTANVAACRAQTEARVLRTNALTPPSARAAATLTFLDPPYHEGLVLPCLAALARAGWLAPGGLVCVETDGHADAPAWPAFLDLLDERLQGRPRLSILRVRKDEALRV